MSDDDKPDSGIKSFSVGFSDGTGPAAVRQAPPYRVLIAGDFGLPEDSGVMDVAGRDAAELLADLTPSVAVTCANRLGSHPASVTGTLTFSSLKDMRPESLVQSLPHYAEAAAAATSGNLAGLQAAGQAFDRLIDLGAPTSGAASDTSDDGSDDDLKSLLSQTKMSGETAPGANKSGLSSFISSTARSDVPSPKPGGVGAEAVQLIASQAKTCLSDPRLRQVLDNWASLRIFLKEIRGETKPLIHLVQMPAGATEAEASDRLAGDDGALTYELYDVVLYANRVGITNDRLGVLKSVAGAAEAFDTVALASLVSNFAGQTAAEVARLDTPQSVVEGPGFESFAGLRSQDRARHVAVFWNDGLLRNESDAAPALAIPAAWVALTMIVSEHLRIGWPALKADQRRDFEDLEVVPTRSNGRELGRSTTAIVGPDCSDGLASIGIAAMNGQPDRTSLFFHQTPVLGIASEKGHYRPVSGRLVLARMNMLLQDVLMEHLDREQPIETVAERLHRGFAQLSESLAYRPGFKVRPMTDDRGATFIDIAVEMPESFPEGSSFSFQIPF